MNWSQLLTTGAQLLLSAGVIGLLTTLLTIRSTKRSLAAQVEKSEADAADVLTGTALRLLPPLEAQIKLLQEQVKVLQEQGRELSEQLERERATSRVEREASGRRIAELIAERDELNEKLIAATRGNPRPF